MENLDLLIFLNLNLQIGFLFWIFIKLKKLLLRYIIYIVYQDTSRVYYLYLNVYFFHNQKI